MSDQPFAAGSCSCGANRLTIRDAPVMMAQCHCVDCKKASGTGHMSLAFFKESDVSFSGAPSSYTETADSGNEKTFHFCPTCGSPLHAHNTGRPGLVAVPVGCLDDSSWFKPQAVVYTEHRMPWDITTEQVPNFPRMPPPQG